MTISTASDLCRIVLITPSGALDVAVPTDVALSDVLPALLSVAGPELAERGLDHAGWVVQRVGEAPLDEDQTLSALGLRDGDTVYLRPRQAELPPLDFDDLIDGISTAIGARANPWTWQTTRTAVVGCIALLLAVGLAALCLGGPAGPRAGTATTIASLLLIGAGIASRALGDRAVGLLLGCAAVPYAALCGLLIAGWPGALSLTGMQLLAGSAAAASAAVVALVSVGTARAVFVAVAITGAAATLGGLLWSTVLGTAAQVASVVVLVAFAFSTSIPAIAFRLANLKLPALPTNAAELQQDIAPVDANMVIARAQAADGYMTALLFAFGAICAGSLAALVTASGWAPLTLGAVVCLNLLLRARPLISLWQRLAILLSAGSGVALLLVLLAAKLDPSIRLGAVLVGLVALISGLAAGAQARSETRLLPYWGRAGDLLESLTAVALLPLAMAVLGIFDWAQALAG